MPKIVDGKQLAEDLKKELKGEVGGCGKKLRLAVVLAGQNPASESFIKRKKAFGREIGVEVEVKKPDEKIWKSRPKLRSYIADIVHGGKNSGVIIQLPLPDEIKRMTQYFLDAVPARKDPDVLSSEAIGKFANGRSSVVPPVVGAIKHVLKTNQIEIAGKNIVVVGEGILVGKPVALWLLSERLPFAVLTSKSQNFSEKIAAADVIISGVGKTGLIKADMVKDGVIAIDCGTSGDSGRIKGDFEQNIAPKAALFMPVPGGIGPLTVAMLFKNLVLLSKNKK